MIVKIDIKLFDDESCFGNLDRIFHHFEDGKHIWLIESEAEINSILNSQWLDTHVERVQRTVFEFTKNAFKRLVYENPSHRRGQNSIIVGKTAAESKIEITDAVDLLNTQFNIWVENEISDAIFLDTVFRLHKTRAKKIRQAFRNNWIRYYHTGGKDTMIQLINHQVTQHRNWLPYRSFIFADSDKMNAQDLPQSTQNLIELCKRINVNFHILEKREIENYLPPIVLKELPIELTDVKETFVDLSQQQRDFYDMSDGFRNHTDGIYSDLSISQRQRLRNGFRFKGFNPKRRLYLLFGSPSVSLVELSANCANQDDPNELKTIIDKILRLL